jgi:hypothetical protein
MVTLCPLGYVFASNHWNSQSMSSHRHQSHHNNRETCCSNRTFVTTCVANHDAPPFARNVMRTIVMADGGGVLGQLELWSVSCNRTAGAPSCDGFRWQHLISCSPSRDVITTKWQYSMLQSHFEGMPPRFHGSHRKVVAFVTVSSYQVAS